MKLSKGNIINLEDFRTPGSKVFTGRDRGKRVRIDSKINEVESTFEKVIIIVPDNVYSIIPSFFEELFLDVVIKLGKEKFHEKFQVTSQGSYDPSRALNEAVERILRNNTALK
jgi:DNA-directed RNA polymerase alpha subunit